MNAPKCLAVAVLCVLLSAAPVRAGLLDGLGNALEEVGNTVSGQQKEEPPPAQPEQPQPAQKPQPAQPQPAQKAPAGKYTTRPNYITLYNERSKDIECITNTGLAYSVYTGRKAELMPDKQVPTYTLKCNPFGQPDNNIATFQASYGNAYVIGPGGARTAGGKHLSSGTGVKAKPKGKTVGQYQQVPGKVAIYNDTDKSIDFTIVGQESNFAIDPHGKFVQPFNPKAATELQFWYWTQGQKNSFGRINVLNGGVYAVGEGNVREIIAGKQPEKSAADQAAPDFANPDAVFADLKQRSGECQSKGAQLCVTKCNYAHKTLTNFINANPEGDPSIFKQRWKACWDAYTAGK